MMPFHSFPRYEIPDPAIQEVHQKTVVLTAELDDSGPQIELLNKILQSVKINLAEIQHIRLPEEETLRIRENGHETLILGFGISPARLSLHVDERLYHPMRLGTQTYIFSNSLERLPDNAEERRALWHALKTYFSLV